MLVERRGIERYDSERMRSIRCIQIEKVNKCTALLLGRTSVTLAPIGTNDLHCMPMSMSMWIKSVICRLVEREKKSVQVAGKLSAERDGSRW